MDRKCILQDDPLRLTPEHWHRQSMESPIFWAIVLIIPIATAAAMHRRAQWSWLWVPIAAIASAYAIDLGLGYARYFYFPTVMTSAGIPYQYATMLAFGFAATLLTTILAVSLQPYIARFTRESTAAGPFQRARIAFCFVTILAAIALSAVSLIDGSWSRHLAWISGAYRVFGPGNSTIELILWPITALLAALLLPAVYRPTIGRLYIWITSGR
ncbi:MAG: hypothetical protein RLZZ352_151 [Pseudomonadota bacterium]